MHLLLLREHTRSSDGKENSYNSNFSISNEHFGIVCIFSLFRILLSAAKREFLGKLLFPQLAPLFHSPPHCCRFTCRAQHEAPSRLRLLWNRHPGFPLSAPCWFPSRPLTHLQLHIRLLLKECFLSSPREGLTLFYLKVRSDDISTACGDGSKDGGRVLLGDTRWIPLCVNAVLAPGTVCAHTIYLLNK